MAPHTEIGLSQVVTRERQTTLSQNMSCIVWVMLVSLCNLQFGLDLVVINGAQAMPGFLRVFGHPNPKLKVGYGIDASFQQAITSMMQVGVILGSLAVGPVATYLGRRRSFLVACATGIIGNTILILAIHKAAIIVARIIFGISNGLFIGLGIVWISEASPAHLRGGLVAVQQVATCIGTIIGACLNKGTSTRLDRLSYQIPLIVLYFVPLWFLVLSWVMPESPRWLLTKNRMEDARHALNRLRGKHYDQELIEAELLSIQNAVQAEEQLTTNKKFQIRQMFSKTERQRSLLTIAAGVFHPASGFTMIAGYATYFFQIAGSKDAFIDEVIKNVVSTGGAIAGIFLNRFIGRRPMLIVGMSIQCVLWFIIAATWSVIPNTVPAAKVIVSMMILFQTVFSASCGPTPLIVAGELPSAHLRAISYGVANAVGFVFGFLTQVSTPYYINPERLNLGPKVGYIWGGSSVITVIFIYFFLPETIGRSLENIDEMFYNKVPLRQFKGYVCSGNVHGDHQLSHKEGVESHEVENVQPKRE